MSKIPRATAKGRPEILNTNVYVTGSHGTGKTTFVEEVLLARKKRLIIVDPKREYGQKNFCEATGIKYDAICETVPDFTETLKKKVVEGNFRLIIQIPGFENEIFKLIGETPSSKESILTNITMLVEEATYWMNSYKIDESLKTHLQYGRHNRNNLVCVTRIPYEANPLLRSESDIIISFRQGERNSIKYFSEIDPDLASELKDLETGDFRIIKGTDEELLEFINQS